MPGPFLNPAQEPAFTPLAALEPPTVPVVPVPVVPVPVVPVPVVPVPVVPVPVVPVPVVPVVVPALVVAALEPLDPPDAPLQPAARRRPRTSTIKLERIMGHSDLPR